MNSTLLGPQAAQAHEFSNPYANVQRKLGIYGQHLFYIMTEFDFAKRDSRLAACGGVVFQRF